MIRAHLVLLDPLLQGVVILWIWIFLRILGLWFSFYPRYILCLFLESLDDWCRGLLHSKMLSKHSKAPLSWWSAECVQANQSGYFQITPGYLHGRAIIQVLPSYHVITLKSYLLRISNDEIVTHDYVTASKKKYLTWPSPKYIHFFFMRIPYDKSL